MNITSREQLVPGANLPEDNFGGRFWGAVVLTEANLQRANLQRARLVGALLSDACLGGADAVDADFRDADLTASRIPGSDDHSTYFSGPKYVGVAELQPASVRGLRLNRSSLADARVSGVDLSAINHVD